MSAQPVKVRLRTYDVGFGDCLLLTVTYDAPLGDGRDERHVLVDFGTRRRSKGGPTLAEVADRIAEHTSGKLDVVLATHRHQDHIGGFGNNDAAETLQALAPQVVVRPWTDMPEPADGSPAPRRLTNKEKALIASLERVGRQAQAVGDRFAESRSTVAERARALALMGIPNADAVRLLEAWAAGPRGVWAAAGDDLDLGEALPAVRIQVLGPPTVQQAPDLLSYASKSNDYWLALTMANDPGAAELVAAAAPDALDAALETVAQPGGVGAPAWLLDKLRRAGTRQVLDIAEGFDDVLNNTSLIVLVTVGERSLLFAGDAQRENWGFTLDATSGLDRNGDPAPVTDPVLRDQLANIDVYKVGHHGSRNATPRRLYDLWDGLGRTPSDRPLTSVLTTMRGVYKKSSEGVVPKPNLLAALSKVGPLYDTDKLPANVWWFDLEAQTAGDSKFVHTVGPRVGT